MRLQLVDTHSAPSPLNCILALSLLTNAVTAQTYILHHRLIPATSRPSSEKSSTSLKPYGSIKLSNSTDQAGVLIPGVRPEYTATFSRVPHALEGLFAGSAVGTDTERPGLDGWYQVGLEDPERDGGEEGWVLASTKACYLNHPLQLTILHAPLHPPSIHLEPAPASSTLIPRDGLCPPTPATQSARNIGLKKLELDVVVKRRARAHSPAPASPQPITLASDGKPAPPPVEKTFLQKYWLPLVGIAIFMVGQLAKEEKPAGEGGGAGGAK